MTEEQYREVVRSIDACRHEVAEVKTQQSIVVRLLNGNPDEDILGIRPRLTRLEQRFDNLPHELPAQFKAVQQQVATLTTEWANLQQRYVGAKWVLGMLGVTNLVTLIALARFLLGIG
jgi:hypothetical protein